MGLFGKRKALGAAGESAARRYLKKSGYQILARNYESPAGELDLICRDGDTIVFVEVKTRTSDDAGDPEDTITVAKMRQLTRVARYWLHAHGRPACPYRFDAVSVVMPPQGRPRIRHIVEAFIPRGSGE